MVSEHEVTKEARIDRVVGSFRYLSSPATHTQYHKALFPEFNSPQSQLSDACFSWFSALAMLLLKDCSLHVLTLVSVAAGPTRLREIPAGLTYAGLLSR